MDVSRKGSLWMVAVALVAACMAAVAATAEPASAQATVAPPLTGEYLSAEEYYADPEFNVGTIEVTADCYPSSGQPTISYTATGPAVGPYLGTYTETGTATLEPSDDPLSHVPVIAFEAEFRIVSALGVVEGTKQLATPPPGSSYLNRARCQTIVLTNTAAFGVHSTYSAEITTPTGTCTTEGTAGTHIGSQDVPTSPNSNFEQFHELFLTGTPPVCIDTEVCPPSDDDDDDGLRDDRESVFSTLLRNSDSDRDGIRDGNDDANRNGEDDEDEDDEDDGCPDEDSDDDGEDDEDEDDEEEDDDDDDDD